MNELRKYPNCNWRSFLFCAIVIKKYIIYKLTIILIFIYFFKYIFYIQNRMIILNAIKPKTISYKMAGLVRRAPNISPPCAGENKWQNRKI